MRHLSFAPAALALALLSCASAPRAAAPAAPEPAASAPRADEACIVWEREVGFARSVHDHDARAFAEHVHPGAVFLQGDGSMLRGRDAIVNDWGKIIRGEGLRLEWHPTSVVQTGAPDVALSRGPYWIELTKPDANPRFVTGVFQSTWVRGGDGVWRVVIDGGTPPPAPATEADVERIKSAIPARCPVSSGS
jgi:uncharacterized protein (TIGR02246 family)